eukprot:4615427-Pyramimonas_sp.AAC.1
MMEYMVPRTSRDPSERQAKCFMWNPSTAVAERAAYRLEAERRASTAVSYTHLRAHETGAYL